jgi:hypothetical protein
LHIGLHEGKGPWVNEENSTEHTLVAKQIRGGGQKGEAAMVKAMLSRKDLQVAGGDVRGKRACGT